MLIDFSVRNFKSIAATQTLDMRASSDPSLRNNVIENAELRKRRNVGRLRSALVYGGNASGKTNLCRAIDIMRYYVIASAVRLNKGDGLNGITPFRLDDEFESQPSLFEVRVLLNGIIFRYGFEATSRLIEREWLYTTSGATKSREALLFLREGQDKSAWVFGPSFKGNREHLRKQTREENCLLLSKAAQEDFLQVVPLFEWFSSKLRVIDSCRDSDTGSTRFAAILSRNRQWGSPLRNLLRVADGTVSGTVPVRNTNPLNPFSQRNLFVARPPFAEGDWEEDHATMRLGLVRRAAGSNRDVTLEYDDESAGTQRFVELAYEFAEAQAYGQTLVVDEFGASLHPMLSTELYEVLNDPDIGTGGAQFIIATQETHLMDLDRVRRDQVYLVEKASNGQTELFSLYDLDPRPKSDAALERQYLAARFGGVPSLGNLRGAIGRLLEEFHAESGTEGRSPVQAPA